MGEVFPSVSPADLPLARLHNELSEFHSASLRGLNESGLLGGLNSHMDVCQARLVSYRQHAAVILNSSQHLAKQLPVVVS